MPKKTKKPKIRERAGVYLGLRLSDHTFVSLKNEAAGKGMMVGTYVRQMLEKHTRDPRLNLPDLG